MAEKYEIPEEGASMSTEYSSRKNKARNVPGSGLYRHPESGQEAIVQSDPLWGNTQAQAFSRLGFKFVREANEGEIKTLPEIAMDTRRAEEGNLKGLAARLDALEDSNAKSDEALKQKTEENKDLAAEVAALRKQLEAAEKSEKSAAKTEVTQAKQEQKTEKAAASHIAEAGATQVGDAQERSAEAAKADAQRVTADREDNKTGNGDGVVGAAGRSTANVGDLGTPGADKTKKEGK